MSNINMIRRLEGKVDSLLILIKWVDFAQHAPEKFQTEALKAYRKKTKIELLRKLVDTTKKLQTARWEYKVMQEHKAVQAALKEFGVPYRSENGVFYLLP